MLSRVGSVRGRRARPLPACRAPVTRVERRGEGRGGEGRLGSSGHIAAAQAWPHCLRAAPLDDASTSSSRSTTTTTTTTTTTATATATTMTTNTTTTTTAATAAAAARC